MKRPIQSIPAFFIFFAFIFSACGERTEETPRDDSLPHEELTIPDDATVMYRNTTLGFAISDKTEWELEETVSRQDEKQMVLINLTKNGISADLRAVHGDWQGLMPLIRLDQRARDAQEDIQISDIHGVRTHLRQFGDDYVRIENNNIIYEITGKPEVVNIILNEITLFEPVVTEPQRIEIRRVRQRDLPEPVRRWVDNLLLLEMMPVAETMIYDSKQYIFASWGMRPTGGYAVNIQQAVTRDDRLYVTLEYTSPGPDEMVTQAITHPFDIAVIETPYEKVEFERYRSNVPRTLARIRGIDDMPEIQAGSRSIKVFTPVPRSEVSDPVKVTGIANVHEANVEYRIIDNEGRTIADGFTTAAAAYEWGYYEFEFTLGDRIGRGESFTIELFYTDMKDGERRDVVSVPLRKK